MMKVLEEHIGNITWQYALFGEQEDIILSKD